MNNFLIDASWRNGVEHYIFISSNTVYPPKGDEPVVETDFLFDEPYPVYFPVGWMTAVTLMVLGVQRFLMEFLRNTTPSFIPGLSQAQVISIILVIVGLVMLYKVGQKENSGKESQAT